MSYSIACLIGFIIVFLMNKKNIKIIDKIKQKFTLKQKYISFTAFVLSFSILMTLLMLPITYTQEKYIEIFKLYIANIVQLLMIPLLLRFYEEYKFKRSEKKRAYHKEKNGRIYGVNMILDPIISKSKKKIKFTYLGKSFSFDEEVKNNPHSAD